MFLSLAAILFSLRIIMTFRPWQSYPPLRAILTESGSAPWDFLTIAERLEKSYSIVAILKCFIPCAGDKTGEKTLENRKTNNERKKKNEEKNYFSEKIHKHLESTSVRIVHR